MTIETVLALCLALGLLAVNPGPGVLAAVSRALASGLGPGLAMTCGIVLGDLVYLAFAVFGLAVVARLMGDVFVVVRVLGGLYLVWLGWRMWSAAPVSFEDRPQAGSKGLFRDFAGGFMLTLANPNVILFYAGFLPTFLDLERVSRWDVAILAGCVIVVIGGALAAYVGLAAKSRRLFRSPGALKRLNRCAGGMMIGLGAFIATRT